MVHKLFQDYSRRVMCNIPFEYARPQRRNLIWVAVRNSSFERLTTSVLYTSYDPLGHHDTRSPPASIPADGTPSACTTKLIDRTFLRSQPLYDDSQCMYELLDTHTFLLNAQSPYAWHI